MKLKQMIAVLSSVAMLLCGCSSANAKDQTYSDTLYDTVVKVQILDPVNENVMSGLKSLCQKYNTMFSMYVEGSDIYNINHAQGMPVDVSSDTATLIKKGIYYGDLSNGSFDITIGSVSQLWDFTSGSGTVPDADAIASALSHVNYKNISVSDNTVQLLDPNASIDVGAIAKGYIADRLKEYLISQDVKSAIINLGGNVLCIGGKPDDSSFKIGIQKPFADRSETIAVMDIKDKSVVSSGVYERCFEQDGTLYHHLLNPKTGYPYDNGLIAVTIISDQSVDGDALSTTCFALGLEDGLKLAESLDDVQAFFVTSDYEIHYTKDFQKEITVTETD